MSGRPSQALAEAMRLIKLGETPCTAARRAGIALSTMYRSNAYKQWKRQTTPIAIKLPTVKL